MNILDYIYSALVSLRNKEYSFSFLINKKVSPNEIDSKLILHVKDTLKALVNRYYFLAWEIKHYLKGVELDEMELDY